jgi:hypothetical protein
MTDQRSGTRLGRSTVPEGVLTDNVATSFRAVSGHVATADSLGPLRDLTGFWEGTGFSLIARPDFDPANEDGFFLELNLLRESIEFTPIGSPIQNRGSRQEDVAMFGVTYLHRVTDATTGGALHIEPGVWLTVPPTTVPPAGPTVSRLSTIPHGNAVCASGQALELVPDDGTMEIPPANTVPFAIGDPVPQPGTKNRYRAYDLGLETKYRTSPLPAAITQELVDDPNSMGRHALAGHTLLHVTHLFASTASNADVGNIPFITENANTVGMDSVFSVERVQGTGDPEFMQLQYSQTAILQFGGMNFPHVTVGTLIKAF